mmetsp:Transcript_1348/g.3885  ORF Transcript_1348/g.3885 Transcript_1348/m.3885 type:complete len:581 (-) Transcript_1348:183-1925(-)
MEVLGARRGFARGVAPRRRRHRKRVRAGTPNGARSAAATHCARGSPVARRTSVAVLQPCALSRSPRRSPARHAGPKHDCWSGAQRPSRNPRAPGTCRLAPSRSARPNPAGGAEPQPRPSSEVLLLLLGQGLRELRLLAQALLALGLLLLQVRLVRVGREAHCLDRVVVHVEAEGGPLVEGRLGLERRVEVRHLARDDDARGVVDFRIDDAVADGLGHDALYVLGAVDLELAPDGLEADARVGQVDVAQARADHVLAKAHDERVVCIRVEGGRRRIHDRLEVRQVALAHRLHDVQVGAQRALQLRLLEGVARRHLAHEELHNGDELGDGEPEAGRCALGRLALRLEQAAMRLRVLELHSLDAAEVVEVARELVVRRALGYTRLGYHLVRLVVELVLQEVAEQQVEEHRLAQRVVVQRRRAVRCQELRPDLRRPPNELVRPGEVVPELGTNRVERALVHLLRARDRRGGEAHGTLVVLCVDEQKGEEECDVRLRLDAHGRTGLARRRGRVHLHGAVGSGRLHALRHGGDKLLHHRLERVVVRDECGNSVGYGEGRKLAADRRRLAQDPALRLGILGQCRPLD